MSYTRQLRSVPDDDLLRRLAELLRQSRRVESDLIAHIAEVDRRRLYAREAVSSMFAYCTEVLHLSEGEAYLRIAAARASREHPVLLTMLADGRLHLTGIAKLAPHLTHENRDRLLASAIHKSKRELEELVAELAPRPEVPAPMRKLPQPRAAQTPAAELRPVGVVPAQQRPDAVGARAPVLELRAERVSDPRAPTPARPAVVEPLSSSRYKVQFTSSAVLREKLERLQALMPDADLAGIIEAAVTEKLERLESRRFAKTKAPRKPRVSLFPVRPLRLDALPSTGGSRGVEPPGSRA